MSHSHTVLFTVLLLTQLVTLWQITKAVAALTYLIQMLTIQVP